MAHAVDLLVHHRVLLDIGIGARDIGFRLVVVVVGDEILDRVIGKEPLHLGIKLGGQRLVGRQHQGRPALLGDHMGHGEGLARAGDAEQHLVAVLGLDAADQLVDGMRLVAGRLVFRGEFELGARAGRARVEKRQAEGCVHIHTIWDAQATARSLARSNAAIKAMRECATRSGIVFRLNCAGTTQNRRRKGEILDGLFRAISFTYRILARQSSAWWAPSFQGDERGRRAFRFKARVIRASWPVQRFDRRRADAQPPLPSAFDRS